MFGQRLRQFHRMMFGKRGKLIRNGDDRINAVVPGQLRVFLNLPWIDLCIPHFGFYDGGPSAAAGGDDDKPVGTNLAFPALGLEDDFREGLDSRGLASLLSHRSEKASTQLIDSAEAGKENREGPSLSRGVGQNGKQARTLTLFEKGWKFRHRPPFFLAIVAGVLITL